MVRVDITQSGRGGTIRYRENGQDVAFDWEFAGGKALALIIGTRASAWDTSYPWAAGRQHEVYETVGHEVVQSQASGGHYECDLDDGTITIYAAPARPSRRPRGPRTTVTPPSVDPDEAVNRILIRGVGAPEVDELAVLGTDLARRLVREARQDRMSVGTRLAALEAMHRWDPTIDIVGALTNELRVMHRASDGLDRALRLAAAHDSPVVRQALLYASWNQTECASACAALLLRLTGGEDPSISDALGYHENSFTRGPAFERLCARVGMTLDD